MVAYNCPADVERLLTDLEHAPEVAHVVVVDHGDGTSSDLAERRGFVTERVPSNPGFGAGQNRGVDRTSAEFVLLLNPDATMEPGALEIGVATLLAEPDVAAVEGVIRNRHTGAPERSGGSALRPVHLLGRATGAATLARVPGVRAAMRHVAPLADWAERAPDVGRQVEALSATALLVRRSAFAQVGGFDESFFLYGEDIDLSRRWGARGYRLLSLPVPWATHDDGSTSAGWWERELRWFQGSLHYGCRWWSTPQYALALVAAAVMATRLTVHRPTAWRSAWSTLVALPTRERFRRPT